jgi:hypothetical protein
MIREPNQTKPFTRAKSKVLTLPKNDALNQMYCQAQTLWLIFSTTINEEKQVILN